MPDQGQLRGRPLLVAGPCSIEEPDAAIQAARPLAEAADRWGFSFVYKASFDKANRTTANSFRGPGLEAGLAILGRIKAECGVSVLTDIHLPEQAAAAAEVVDVLQIPAFLCRQTDLLLAAAQTGLPVNLKKGPFLAPSQVRPATEKLRSGGTENIWVTERGSSFGHGDLVVDFRSLDTLRELGCPLLMDASHASQQPGALGDRSGGNRRWVPILARAAAGAGYDGLYLEVHPDPDRAQSDSATQWPLDRIDEILEPFCRLWDVHATLEGRVSTSPGPSGRTE